MSKSRTVLQWSCRTRSARPTSAFIPSIARSHAVRRPNPPRPSSCIRSWFSSSPPQRSWKSARKPRANYVFKPLKSFQEDIATWRPREHDLRRSGLNMQEKEVLEILQIVMLAENRKDIGLDAVCEHYKVDLDKFATLAHYMKFGDGDGSDGWTVRGRLGQEAMRAAAEVGNRTAVHAFIQIGIRSQDISNEIVRSYIPKLKVLAEENVDSMILYGKVLELQGQLEKAEAMFKKATVALQVPKTKKMYSKELEKEVKAQQHLARQGAQWVYSRRISAWTSLALVQFDLGKSEEAKLALKRGADEDGDPYACYFYANLLTTFQNGKFLEPVTMEWYNYMTRAAMSGDPQAAYALAVFYLDTSPQSVKDTKVRKLLEYPMAIIDPIKWVFHALTFRSTSRRAAKNRELAERLKFEEEDGWRRTLGYRWLSVSAYAPYMPASILQARHQMGTTSGLVKAKDVLQHALAWATPEHKAAYPNEVAQAQRLLKGMAKPST